MMDISCNACGKRYRIDESRMKSATAKVKCKACGHVIIVHRPGTEEPPPERPAAERIETPAENAMRTPDAAAVPADFLVATQKLEAMAPEALPADAADALAIAPRRKVRFGIFGKILLVMLLVSLLPFGVFWFITFQETAERLRADSEALMTQTAKGLAAQVDDWIRANVTTLRTAALLPDILSMEREKQEPVLKAVQKEHPWMYLAFTLGTDGMNIARNDDQALRDYSDRQYYKDVMAGKALAWQTVVGRTSNVPALILAVPIKNGERVVGVLAAAMTVDELSRNVATWKKGQSGFAFLLDEKGYVIAHPQRKFVETRENLSSHPLVAAYRQKGWTTITAPFTNEKGRSVLGHARSGSYGWVLALQQEEIEVFEALNVLQNFAYMLLAITVLLVFAIAWFAARSLVTPIMKLTDAAERMSLGELNLKIDVASRDEIGLLAEAIKRMQTSLQIAMQRLRRRRG
jgi:methyl-accepting chemotaxis protein